MDLDDSMQFETKLKFWIDNTRPLPSDYDIEVEMTIPLDVTRVHSQLTPRAR